MAQRESGPNYLDWVRFSLPRYTAHWSRAKLPREKTNTSMGFPGGRTGQAGKWMALTAAFLGWMFDGLEMGLFPLVARPALGDLLGQTNDEQIGKWFAVANALFLVGAATGGVLFGWLGDRLGRVRAITLSVLTYAIFTGLCGIAGSVEQVVGLRFFSALGMGGEWSLGVALVMEIWPDNSRALLAGLIGAAANLGFLLIALAGLWLASVLPVVETSLLQMGMSQEWANSLTAHSGWRLLMLAGMGPALLAIFIQFFVPESERWRHQQNLGATSNWAARDLLGVLVGAGSACTVVYLWMNEFGLLVRLIGSVLALAVTFLGYSYPIIRYLGRARQSGDQTFHMLAPTLRRIFLAACLSGIPLLGTWAMVQWAPNWADQLAGPRARSVTQIASAGGAIVGTIAAALMGNWLGRRITYALLCLGSLISALALFWLNQDYGLPFLASMFLAGVFTASFYGWLPLYLPELFPTAVRAMGLGFSYNFGRIIAAVGALQTGNLMGFFQGDYRRACSVMSLIYLVGLGLIWLAPETHGKPLPE
jgi:SHS family sialic acid transporter-like MFS transporter